MPRARRKNEHIRYVQHNAPKRADFSDITFVHNCLPNTNLDDISLETSYMGRTFRSPLFFNAVTGGSKMALKINRSLAAIARSCGIPMAVGSQMAALENGNVEDSFTIARQVNPEGVIWANIGAYADLSMAEEVIRMINADGIQVHLNTPQELMMRDGDRRFEGATERIACIAENISVPLIAKEVGFGIAREQAEELIRAGVSAIDVSGTGGTNFLEVECLRSNRILAGSLKSWGIPTAISLIECAETVKGRVTLFASGGMHAATDIAKALALGADAVGMAGYPVYHLLKKGPKALFYKLKRIESELRLIMMLLGAQKIEALRKTPLVITGFTSEWLQSRGINPAHMREL